MSPRDFACLSTHGSNQKSSVPRGSLTLHRWGGSRTFGPRCYEADWRGLKLSFRELLTSRNGLLGAGLFAALSRFTRWTFLGFGLAVLPFFVFDWWFYAVEPIFNELILLDAAGNVIFIALCARGYVLLRAEPDRSAVKA